jgi:hypothetical protein
MKTFLSLITSLTLVASASGQTLWVGGATDFISDAANWDPANLPTNSGNVGTINSDAFWQRVNEGGTNTLTNYYLNITGGTLNTTTLFIGTLEYDGGALNVNGGAFNMTKSFDLGANNSTAFTVNSGSASITGALVVRDAAVEVNGGSLTVNNNVALINSANSSFTMNGGTVTLSTGHTFGTPNFSGGGAAFFNGGTLTGGTLNYRHAWTLTLGGSTAGSATFDNFGGASHNNNNISMNWLSGSLMSLTITSAADWAETYWNIGQITYNSQDFNDLGNWATVSTTIFDWDGTTNTLALIPEPSTWALLAIGMTALVAFRRRRQA